MLEQEMGSTMKQMDGQMSESLMLGALLALAGGFFDAYTFLCRGGVFANAQTGNIVLFGLRLAEREWMAALSYLLPVAAFVLGVVAAEYIRRKSRAGAGSDGWHWRQSVVLMEAVVLAAVAFWPQRWNAAANIAISFVCALQVEAFRKVRGSAFASTMCTGNLRSGTEQLVIWRQTGSRTAARRARHYYGIILFFALGAAAGGISTVWLSERALLLTLLPLAAVVFIMFIRKDDGHGGCT